jgi:glycosyltransferase involved in cell wall biosynthesis
MLKYKTMKIAIDLTQIPADKTGIGIYALNLVREMCRLNQTDGKFNFFFFVQDDDEELIQLIKNFDKCTIIPVKSTIFRKMILRVFFEQVLLPRKCRQLKVDLIYSSHYTIPYLTRIKRVVVFHDMTFYLFPELHQKIKRLYFKTLIPISVRKSKGIITVSESTRNDMLTRFKHGNPGKITVIHHGVDLFKENEKEKAPLCEKIMEKYGLTAREYLLFIGTLEPRKNIANIIKAFHHVRQSDDRYKKKYKLVIVGKKGWFYNKIFETVKKFLLEEAVIFTGYVSEEEKQALLLKAFLFVYPSFYEGFGIPVLEAMASGIPVITGNISSLPEVAGDAAVLVNPHLWQEISTAMLKLLSNQPLHETLSQKGLIQAKKFSWEKTAEKTLELFKKIAADEHGC